jgi:hypothetical protein
MSLTKSSGTSASSVGNPDPEGRFEIQLVIVNIALNKRWGFMAFKPELQNPAQSKGRTPDRFGQRPRSEGSIPFATISPEVIV